MNTRLTTADRTGVPETLPRDRLPPVTRGLFQAQQKGLSILENVD